MSKWVKGLRTKVKKFLPTSKRRIVEESYEFKEDLGTGNYSIVKKAIHKKTGEVVAIKIYDKRHVSFAKSHTTPYHQPSYLILTKLKISVFDKGCINTEVEILKDLKHPNVVNIKEAYDGPKRLYIVMEFMGGGELLGLIQKRKVFPEKEACKIFHQIISALSYLHSLGIVHRDIKPDNLLMTTEGDDAVLKIADFGFAKRIGEGVLFTPCGSPVYTAPEIIREEAYNKSVDMWSAGVLLYILLCGFPPFYHREPSKLFEVIEKGVFGFPSAQWSNISSSAKELVSSLLKLAPEERLTAKQALSHPWLASLTPPTTSTTTTTTTTSDPSLTPRDSEKNNEFKEKKNSTESPYQLDDTLLALDFTTKTQHQNFSSLYNQNSNSNSNSNSSSGECDNCATSAASSYSFEVRIDELSVKSYSSTTEDM